MRDGHKGWFCGIDAKDSPERMVMRDSPER